MSSTAKREPRTANRNVIKSTSMHMHARRCVCAHAGRAKRWHSRQLNRQPTLQHGRPRRNTPRWQRRSPADQLTNWRTDELTSWQSKQKLTARLSQRMPKAMRVKPRSQEVKLLLSPDKAIFPRNRLSVCRLCVHYRPNGGPPVTSCSPNCAVQQQIVRLFLLFRI